MLASGEQFELEDWEAGFLEDLFAGMAGGWLREAWLVVPEGNGKSTMVALLVMYLVEYVPEASIPVAAAARDQAEIIFSQGRGFKRRSPKEAGKFTFKPGRREIVFDTGALAKIFASDAGMGDGIIPYPLEVIDELHRHKDLELYRTWAGKLDKEGAVLVVISTAGEPGSEFEELRERMRQDSTDVTRDGCFGRFVGPTSLLHEYAVPEGADVLDLVLVAAANPSSRITVDTLAAKRSRPSFSMSHWRRLTCNMPSRSDEAAITEREWDDCAAPEGEREIPDGQGIWLGLDVGWYNDTTALVPLWVRDRDYRLFGPAVILEPPGDGSQLDAHLIERAFIEIHNRTPIHTVVMDMTNAAQLAQWLEEELGCLVVDRSQKNPAAVLDYARFTEGLRTKAIKHCGDAGLRRHVLNAIAVMLPGGDSRFARPKESRTVSNEARKRRVIDALAAACFAHTTAVAEFYDEQEPEPLIAWSFV